MALPTGVLGIPTGKSVVVVWVGDPAIEYYNVYVSVGGGGFNAMITYSKKTRVSIGPFPVGVSILIKVDGILYDGEYTEKVDAKLGKLSSSTVSIDVTSMPGSTIVKDTLMSLHPAQGDGGSVLIKFPSQVNF